MSSFHCLQCGPQGKSILVERAIQERTREPSVLECAKVIEASDASADDDSRAILLQLDRTLEIGAHEHAVPADIGVDDRLYSICRDSPGNIIHHMSAGFLPAAEGNPAMSRIEANCDAPASRFGQGLAYELWMRDNGCSKYQPGYILQRHDFPDPLNCPEPASQLYLHIRADALNDSLNDNGIFPVAECTVEIHDVEPPGALPDQMLRHGNRIFLVDRFPGEVTLAQPNHAARADVDGGEEFQRVRRSVRKSRPQPVIPHIRDHPKHGITAAR